MSEIKFRVVCMRCTAVIHVGDPGAPVSHGYCEPCFHIEMEIASALPQLPPKMRAVS